MYQRKQDKDICCPLEYGMELFGGKWSSRIICMLAALDMPRYSELRTQMGNITDAVLTSTLKFLIANGIILRKSYNEFPRAWTTLFLKKAIPRIINQHYVLPSVNSFLEAYKFFHYYCYILLWWQKL